jgi:outer membrane protein OmpA-like peptidoglycan-associated protein
MTPTRILCVLGALALAQAGRQPDVNRIPLARGLVVSHTEHGTGGERESVTEIEEASTAGVRYGWRYRELHTSGDTIFGSAERFVSAADLASAARVHFIYDANGPVEHPGYTAWTVSSAVYQQLRATGTAEFQMMTAELASGAGAFGGLGLSLGAERLVPVRWRGTLTRMASAPEPFPLLVNGRRVTVPALHARAQFTARGERWTPELWILADSAHPLLLRVVSTDPPKTLQVTRVDLPDETTAAGGAGAPGGMPRMRGIERELASACRVELPGIYFAFNSAALDPASDRTIASVAAMLARHRDWTVTIEGHTDSIGGDAANRALSGRRAAAVRERLVTAHRVDPARLKSAGFGASRPREPNATIEGRARNRRVELVRACGTSER